MNRLLLITLIIATMGAFALAAKKIPKSAKDVTPKVLPKGFTTIPVWGSDQLKYYYTELEIGNPPQKTSVIIDTGSDYLAFPCSTCGDKCGKHKFPAFDLKKSPSAKPVKCGQQIGNYKCNRCNKDGYCTFGRSYLEGSSLGGIVYTDEVAIVNDKAFNLAENTRKLLSAANGVSRNLSQTMGTFGCTNHESGLFHDQLANGIMGLGPVTNTLTSSPNVIDSLFTAHKSKSHNFSICLGTDGGYLTFGGYNVNKHLKGEKIQTVPYTSQYHIKFNGPGYGKPISKNSKKMPWTALVDSGTTMTYLQTQLYKPTVARFNKWCADKKNKKNIKFGKICGGIKGYTDNFCPIYDPKVHKTYDNFFAQFPSLYFTLENKVEYIWFAKDYLYPEHRNNDGTEKWCTSVVSETNSWATYSTFGALFMRHYDFYFNKEKKTISFVRSECEDKAAFAYPVMGIKNLVNRAKLMLAGMFSSASNIAMTCFVLGILIAFGAYKVGYFNKLVEESEKLAEGQPDVKEVELGEQESNKKELVSSS